MGSPTIGLRNLVYAKMTSVDDGIIAPAYGPVIAVSGQQTAKITPKTDELPVYADDVAGEVIVINAYDDIEIATKRLPIEVQADWLGHTTVVNGTIIRKNNDIPPYIAIGFKSIKANGKFVYKWFKKVIFVENPSEFESKSDKAAPKYPTIKGIALPRLYDGETDREADEDSPSYTAGVGTNWFTSVEQAADITPPTILTVVPANGAAAVARAAAIVWTFSESIPLSCVNNNNFYLLSTVDGSVVAAPAPVYNDTNKTVTLTPATQLAATTKYIALVDNDVTDLSGNHYVQVNSTFTTGT